MRNLAKFEIIGRIGKIDAQAKVTHLTIAANYPYRNDKTGEWTEETYWNRVTIFSDGIRTYIDRNASVGDLVRVEGRMRDSSYEKGGETIYTVDRIGNDFGILASRAEAKE